MVHEIIAAEDDRFSHKLSENAASGPNVNRLSIGIRVNEYLRRTIRSGRNVVSLIVIGNLLLSQIHISNLELKLLGDENVLGLEVAVYDVCGVHEVECVEGLVEDELDHFVCDVRLGGQD